MFDAEVTAATGRLIAFEGIDGAGKSTLLRQLPTLLATHGARAIICGERRSPIAHTLQDSVLRTLSPFLKAYLFAADRAWCYERECLPALNSGHLVLWDRYVDSALVYRSQEVEGSGSQILELVRQINTPFRQADLTIILDIAVETSQMRARGADVYPPDFLHRVRNEYLRLASSKSTYAVVNAEQAPELLARDVVNLILQRFLEHAI